MDWDAIGAIGEVVGAMAVVATLGYLAVQIKHSTTTQRASTTDSIWSEWRQHQRDTYISTPQNIELYVTGMKDFAGLTGQQKRLFTFILASEWLFMVNVMKQYEFGNIEQKDHDGLLTFWLSQIRTPGGAQWWDQSRAGFLAHDVETLERFAAGIGSMSTVFDNYPHFDPTVD